MAQFILTIWLVQINYLLNICLLLKSFIIKHVTVTQIIWWQASWLRVTENGKIHISLAIWLRQKSYCRWQFICGTNQFIKNHSPIAQVTYHLTLAQTDLSQPIWILPQSISLWQKSFYCRSIIWNNLFYSTSIDCDLNNLIKGYLTVIQIISSDTIWLAQVNLSETISL